MNDIVEARSAEGRRAFVTPRGPELSRSFTACVITPFLQRQIDDGDAESRTIAAPAASAPAQKPPASTTTPVPVPAQPGKGSTEIPAGPAA